MSELSVYAIEYAIEEVQRTQHLVNTDMCLYHLEQALFHYKEALKTPYPWEAYIVAVTLGLFNAKKMIQNHRNARCKEIQSGDSEI